MLMIITYCSMRRILINIGSVVVFWQICNKRSLCNKNPHERSLTENVFLVPIKQELVVLSVTYVRYMLHNTPVMPIYRMITEFILLHLLVDFGQVGTM